MDFKKLIYLGVGAIIGFFLSLAKDWLMEGKKDSVKEKLNLKIYSIASAVEPLSDHK